MFDAETDTSSGRLLECRGGCGQIVRMETWEMAVHLSKHHPRIWNAVFDTRSPLGKELIGDLWAWERYRYNLRRSAEAKRDSTA